MASNGLRLRAGCRAAAASAAEHFRDDEDEPGAEGEIDERITGGCDMKYEMHNECGSIV